MARLYSNENFPIPVVLRLPDLGHDVVTIQERGRGNEAMADPEGLRNAIEEDRAVLTLNRKDLSGFTIGKFCMPVSLYVPSIQTLAVKRSESMTQSNTWQICTGN